MKALPAVPLAAAILLFPTAVQAQRGGPGFLFQEPTVTFGVRLGYDRALAGSDLFDFTTSNLTIDRSQFSSGGVAGDMGFRLSPRTNLVVGIGYAGVRRQSEFRHWVDNNNQPITQQTTFKRVPLTAMFKGYLGPRGGSIGRFAWIPTRYAPWIGAGAGVVWYQFRQAGDFIDASTLRVFRDEYQSSGWTPLLLVAGGMEMTLTPHVALAGELRYTRAHATLGQDFVGFEKLDLSGLAGTAGFAFRF